MAKPLQIINWFGQDMTRGSLAAKYNLPYNTICNILLRYDFDLPKCRARFKRPNVKPGKIAKKYPYRDGKMMTLREMIKRQPHMEEETLKFRLRHFAGDYDKIFHRGRIQSGCVAKKVSTWDLSDMGPRVAIESIPGPSEYEHRLWGA